MRKELFALEWKALSSSVTNVTRPLQTLESTHLYETCSWHGISHATKMNWTGGSLQRTKNANKGVLQRQKAYFARARTHLQSASNSPTTPFRPSYLGDNDSFDFMEQIPTLGSGVVQHAGHPARGRGERLRRKTPPADRRPVPDNPRLKREAGRKCVKNRPASRLGAAKRGSEAQHDERRRATETDLETQLLEANRKRLLRQQDWIGINSPKPVHLQYFSNKEKDKIGKRRKTQGKLGATARLKSNANMAGQPPQNAGDGLYRAFMAPEVRNDVENIRIRIGTDALSTAYSNQLNHYARSQASSEPMLFDQEGQDTERARYLESVQLVNPEPHSARNASRHSNTAPHERPLTDEKVGRDHDFTYYRDPRSMAETSEQGSLDFEQIEGHSQNYPVGRAPDQTSESSALAYRVTHHAEGIERPLRLVFGEFNSSASAQSHIAPKNNIGEPRYTREAASAGESQRGHMHQVIGDVEQSTFDEGAAALAIVDEEPWKTFLSISEGSSSHPAMAVEPGNSLLRSYPTVFNNEAVTNWSQRATQCDRTDISSSPASASLPSLKRGIEKPVLARQAGVKSNWRDDAVGTKARGLDEDEKLWQAFVFGSDNTSSSEAFYSLEQTQRMSKDFGEASSRYVPLSVAVSSVSSTPFRPISEVASCISDKVQDAAASALAPGSRAISSPAFYEFVEDVVSEGEDGHGKAEGSLLVEQAVTQASLQTNVACDTGLASPEMFCDSKPFRNSLDRPHGMSDISSTRAVASRRRAASSSPSYDGPVSYDESSGGLDCIDRDRLT
ncbi:uncharacterized protein K460DRAFT_354276 [Cucurbitaria berberidis CBS 394.84]|uniref:Uncharacterized protein n=1 Tax=Cucurbitaria berberidis CBS 394.84 TaxID=1168544 RepID=A0A9P4LBC4_9PLEO|nr:uncharacterized protein K460DRAFT_354276 [Cucurbitaria berberidis CBS 394.84]KAF1849426.1 hypothetical protein K460DRAFT_354276 [Cucurbitaria berberidis CBS 394.84]